MLCNGMVTRGQMFHLHSELGQLIIMKGLKGAGKTSGSAEVFSLSDKERASKNTKVSRYLIFGPTVSFSNRI